MADSNQLRKLMEGVDAWNQWRSENPDVSISLRDVDLRDAELTKVNLRHATLSGSNFRDAILDDADLTSAFLDHANLNGAKAQGTLFVNAFMKNAQMNNIYAPNARFIEADLSGCSLIRAMLMGADMTKARCKDVILSNSELGASNLREADFRDANLVKSSFFGAYLEKADLRRCESSKARFKEANLSQAKLRGTQLSAADFLGAKLTRTDLREVFGLTCEQLTKARDWETAYRDEALACGAEIPNPDRGVNIEVPTSHYGLVGYPPTIMVGEETNDTLPVMPAKVVRVETAEEIDEATGIRFETAPAVVISEATKARDLTFALQTILRDMRLNSPEVAQVQSLLDSQVNTLDNVIRILQSGGDKEVAARSFRDLLRDVLETYLKVLSDEGVTRGILAAAAIALMSVAGINVGAVVGTLVAGSIVGIDAKALKKILKSWRQKKNSGD